MIGLAQAQVLAQTIHSDNYDLRSVGLLGFSGALIVVDFAIKDEMLGGRWWVPLVFLGISSLLCLWPTEVKHGGEEEIDRGDLGPDPRKFYEKHYEKPAPVFQLQMLSDLSGTVDGNKSLIGIKEGRLKRAVTLLACAVISGVIVAVGLQNLVGALGSLLGAIGAGATDLWHRISPTLSSLIHRGHDLGGSVWHWLRSRASEAGHIAAIASGK